MTARQQRRRQQGRAVSAIQAPLMANDMVKTTAATTVSVAMLDVEPVLLRDRCVQQ